MAVEGRSMRSSGTCAADESDEGVAIGAGPDCVFVGIRIAGDRFDDFRDRFGGGVAAQVGDQRRLVTEPTGVRNAGRGEHRG